MSVINQVLSDLEKRGATTLPDDTVVRAVPVQHDRRTSWLVITGSVLGLAAAGLWWYNEKAAPAPPSPLPAPIQIISAQENPAPPEIISTESPTTASALANEDSTAPTRQPLPMMQLSFELSSIPLPSNLRVQSQPAVNNVKASKQNSTKPTKATKEKLPAKEKMLAKEKLLANTESQIKQFSAQQLLENEFRRATALVQQGRSNEAYSAFEAVLQSDAGYDAARQAMVAIQLDSKRNTEAERLLQDGLQHNIKHSGFAMLLARLQVERGALPQALGTLNKTLPYVDRQADYQAFVAALLQRQNNHQEAIAHYQIAVQLAPNSGVWLMGLGISLHAAKRNEEARDAFKRAIETRTLSVELQAFVEQRLKELG